MSVEDQLRSAAVLLQQKWFDPATARQAVNGTQNDLGEANQAFGLRVKMCEDRLDAIEKILRKAGAMK